MNRRIALKLMVTSAAGSLAAACQPSRSAAPAAQLESTTVPANSAVSTPEPTAVPTLTGSRAKVEMWWNISNEKDIEAYQAAFDKFNQSQDKTELRIGRGKGNDAFLTAVSGGKPPDIYMTWDGSEPIGTWAHNGVLKPLDDFIAKDKVDLSKAVPALARIGNYSGKQWGVPWQFDSILLFYNKKHMQEVGLDPEKPPQTLPELYEAAKKLTKTDSSGNVTRMGFRPPNWDMLWFSFFNLFSGEFIDSTGTKFTADHPGNLAAMVEMQNMWKLYGDPTVVDKFTAGLGGGLTPDDPFLKGQISMTLDGDWRMGYVARYTDQKYGADFGVTTIPYPEGKKDKLGASYIFGMNLVTPYNAPHPDEAWEAMRFFQQPETDALVALKMWNLPWARENFVKPELQAMPGFSVALDNAAKNGEKFTHMPVTPATSQYADAIKQQMDLVVHGKATPDQAAKEINSVAQQALDTALAK